MSETHESLRYAHDVGHTDVRYSEDGKKVLTCGHDGDIRVWSSEDSKDPVAFCFGEWAQSIAQKGDKIYVSTESNDVKILTLADGVRVGVLDRSTAPVNHIAVDKNSEGDLTLSLREASREATRVSSELIALAGEGKEIKLITFENSEKKDVTIFDELNGPVLSIALCSKSKRLAASCGDTKLRIWNYETKDLLQEISCCSKVNSFSNAKLLCRMDFEPLQGMQLAYPNKNSVVVLQVSDWSPKTILTCDEVDSDYSIVQYSPTGKYILAASDQGDFVVWHVPTKEVFHISKHESALAICGLMWNPQGNGQVAFTDVEGQLGIINLSIKGPSSKPLEPVENMNIDERVNSPEDDMDDKLSDFNQDEPEPELNLDGISDNVSVKSERSLVSRQSYIAARCQEAFMPSSTPIDLDPRYMCWNEVGIVRCFKSSSADSQSIEVEFHDSGFHSSMMLQDFENYIMGSISKSALVIANTSKIHVVPLAASSKEWTLVAGEDDEIILITTSENLVSFISKQGLIAVTTIYGTQRGVLTIPGVAVSMAAYKNTIMVAYHCSRFWEDQNFISIRLITFEGTSIISNDISSGLRTGETLSWLGFSDNGTPAMMDSSGMVSLYPQNANTWIPFCDTSKASSQGFFLTAVFESNQTIGGIKGVVYPGFTPRPVMCELPIAPPFAENSVEKTKLEMDLFTWSMLNIPENDKQFKMTAIKTFALACKNDFDERAFEVIEIYVPDSHTISLALKLAAKYEKRRLIEKLTNLLAKVSSEREDKEENEADKSIVLNNRPTHKRFTLSGLKRTSKNKADRVKVPATPDIVEDSQTSVAENSENFDVSTYSEQENSTIEQTITDSMIQESKQNVNPFLKRLHSANANKNSNPLSLTDKFAGVSYEGDSKENRNSEPGDKRKLSGFDTVKPKEKQRKLDMFRFKKS